MKHETKGSGADIGAVKKDGAAAVRDAGAERARILKERAQKFSAPGTPSITEDVFEAVEFVLAHEVYAVASEHVSEIYQMSELTPVPCTPDFVLGVINLRGHILSVIDIKKFFNLPEKGLTDLNKVIVLKSGEMEFGILADSVTGIRLIDRGMLDTSFATITGRREEYLLGVTKDRVAVLDASRLLTDPGIVVREIVDI